MAMRAVWTSVSESALRMRRARGLDRYDEMWEGELHLVLLPSWDLQGTVDLLGDFLRDHCTRNCLGVLRSGVGVCDPRDPENSYRVPDLSFVAAGSEGIIQDRGIVGPADAVIEVRSPDDETYEKLSFYASLGVREVVVIHRDTRKPEVYRLAGNRYIAVGPGKDGWVAAEVLRIRLRSRSRRKGMRLEVKSLIDSRHAAEI